jgi:hypothetical protein
MAASVPEIMDGNAVNLHVLQEICKLYAPLGPPTFSTAFKLEVNASRPSKTRSI